MSTPNTKLDDILIEYARYVVSTHAIPHQEVPTKRLNHTKAKQALNDYFYQEFIDLVGEDYVFDRPKEDYLPNVYIHLKAKNERNAELIAQAKIRFGVRDE